MKRMKLGLSAFAIVAVVGSALAFNTSRFIAGNVYCPTTTVDPTKSCEAQFTAATFQVDNSNGTVTQPCPAGVTPYIDNLNDLCTQAPSGDKYDDLSGQE